MTDSILSAVTTALVAAGVPTIRAWPETALDPGDACVCVEMKSCKASGSGMGEYLGIRAGAGGAADTELYGLRVETEIGLTVLAPTAADCTDTLDAVSAAMDSLPAGLKVQALCSGAVQPDKRAGMFRCEASLCAWAYFIAESDEETGLFTDFELKGVIRNADE